MLFGNQAEWRESSKIDIKECYLFILIRSILESQDDFPSLDRLKLMRFHIEHVRCVFKTTKEAESYFQYVFDDKATDYYRAFLRKRASM